MFRFKIELPELFFTLLTRIAVALETIAKRTPPLPKKATAFDVTVTDTPREEA